MVRYLGCALLLQVEFGARKEEKGVQRKQESRKKTRWSNAHVPGVRSCRQSFPLTFGCIDATCEVQETQRPSTPKPPRLLR